MLQNDIHDGSMLSCAPSLPSMFEAGVVAAVTDGTFFALFLDDLASSSIREGGWANSSCTNVPNNE
jgi:hypothetical protein